MGTRGMRQDEYDRHYTAGFNSSTRLGGGMDAAETRYLSRKGLPWSGPEHWAWEDGWLDAAVGREKFHLRDCPDHDRCGS